MSLIILLQLSGNVDAYICNECFKPLYLILRMETRSLSGKKGHPSIPYYVVTR